MYARLPLSSTRTTKYREESRTASTDGFAGSYSALANTVLSRSYKPRIRIIGESNAHIRLDTDASMFGPVHSVLQLTCGGVLKLERYAL